MERLHGNALTFCLRWLLLFLALPSLAQEPRVTGSLSTTTATVGEAVEYTLTIQNADADDPPSPELDGLELRGTSRGSQFSIVNGDVSKTFTFTFTLVPKREGVFNIPALEVKAGGRVLKTQPVTLTVGPQMAAKGAGDIAWAEIRLPKNTAYVGETLAAELMLYLDNSVRWDLRQMPQIQGDGFTTQPFGKATQRRLEIAGKEYLLAVFRTVVTPGKAGKISIGPLPAKLVFSKPITRGRRYDPFLQPFGPAQEMETTAPAVELDVQPLPVAGRPADFSGAIGNFEFDAVGTPNRVNVGEPVEMTLTVRGQGNFDRITAPPVAEAEGWRAYDAEAKFQPADELGISGTKTFKMPVAPTAAKTTMPPFAFTFFDPEKAKYVTLKSAPAPLTVTGAPVAAVAPAIAAAPAPTPVAPAPEDIRPTSPDIGPLLALAPPMKPSELFLPLLAPLPLLVMLLAVRARRADANAARIAEIRRQRAAQLARVRAAQDRAEALDAAARVLQADVALSRNVEFGTAELPDILSARALDATTARAVEEIFAARAELLYAGGVADRFGATERDRLLETLSAYERSAAK